MTRETLATYCPSHGYPLAHPTPACCLLGRPHPGLSQHNRNRRLQRKPGKKKTRVPSNPACGPSSPRTPPAPRPPHGSCRRGTAHPKPPARRHTSFIQDRQAAPSSKLALPFPLLAPNSVEFFSLSSFSSRLPHTFIRPSAPTVPAPSTDLRETSAPQSLQLAARDWTKLRLGQACWPALPPPHLGRGY